MGASLTQGHTYFSSGCNFMMGLGKTKLCTKFEIARFSCCVNIVNAEILLENPKIWRKSRSLRPPPLFPLGVILWWALANLSCALKLKSLASAVAEILKGKHQISGSSPSSGTFLQSTVYLKVRFIFSFITICIAAYCLSAKWKHRQYMIYAINHRLHIRLVTRTMKPMSR